jgi:hypothetical protein
MQCKPTGEQAVEGEKNAVQTTVTEATVESDGNIPCGRVTQHQVFLPCPAALGYWLGY